MSKLVLSIEYIYAPKSWILSSASKNVCWGWEVFKKGKFQLTTIF